MPDLQTYKKFTWIATTLVVLATFIIYLPALQNGFVNWDDHLYVTENQNIRSLDLRFLRWDITAVVASLWHPLTMFSLALDYAIWGLNPFGYHLTNILFHSFNTFLVFILIVRLIICKTNPSSFTLHPSSLIAASVTTLLFGIHPLRVESVVWVSERKDVLCAFFFLLSILAYLSYARSPKRRLFYAASLVSFSLALMSKPMAVTLPLVLLILDFYPLTRLTIGFRGVLAEKLPFFVLSVLSSLVTVWAHHSEKALVEEALGAVEPFLFMGLVAVRACIFYLTKMVLPFNLSPLYPRPDRVDPFSFEYIVSFILLLMITYIAFRSLKRNRLYPAVWFYYIVTLIPVIGIVPVGAHAAADRYTYLPSLGPFLLLGLGVGKLFERCSKKQQAALAAALIFLFGTLGSKTQAQISVWKDSVTLWSRVIGFFPYSTKAYINRGGAYVGLGNDQEAIKDLDMAIRLDPGSLKAYRGRGNAYNRLGNYQQAVKDYSKAIELNPLEDGDNKEAIKAYINRGVTYIAMGKYLLAIKDSNEAIRLDPGYAEAYNLRGSSSVNTGDYRQAIKDLDTAIQLDPVSVDAYYNRGTVYRILGNNYRAINDFSMTIRLNPRYAEAYNNRGNAYRDLGNDQRAVEDYSMAVKINPQDAIAYRNRGIAYKNMGNNEQAIKDFKKADALSIR